jgi:hypothetical protein
MVEEKMAVEKNLKVNFFGVRANFTDYLFIAIIANHFFLCDLEVSL